jgi:excisionase family DNA binding protein
MAERPEKNVAVTGGDPVRLAWNVDEAAGIIGISRRHLYEFIRTGELRSVKIGTRRLVRHSDLVAFVQGLEEAA